MRRYQNLHLADKSLYMTYRTLFPTDIESAQSLLEDSQLDTKTYRAVDINSDTTALTTIENYYMENIPEKLEQLLLQHQLDIDALEYLGEYSETQAYYRNNVVVYNSQLYFCIIEGTTSVTGVVPTDTTTWLCLGLQGSQGNPTLDLVVRGLWTSGTTYNEKDVVAHNNYFYVAKSETSAEPPSEDAWLPLLPYTRKIINFSRANLEVGDIYWKVVIPGEVEYEPFLTSTGDALYTSDNDEFHVIEEDY